jgi:hypothetical protein
LCYRSSYAFPFRATAEDSLHDFELEEKMKMSFGQRAFNQVYGNPGDLVQLHVLEVPPALSDVLVIDKHIVKTEAGFSVSIIEVGINLQLQYGVEIPAADHPRLREIDACLTVKPGIGKSFQTLLDHFPFQVSQYFFLLLLLLLLWLLLLLSLFLL